MIEALHHGNERCRAVQTLCRRPCHLVAAIAIALPIAGMPVKADTTDDLKVAAEDFQAHCAPCHGSTAKGDGPAGKALKVPPADLTRITQRHGGAFPESLIFETIEGLNMPAAHGTRDMPVWGDVFIGEAVGSSVSIDAARQAALEVDRRIGRLVRYLESIQAGQ